MGVACFLGDDTVIEWMQVIYALRNISWKGTIKVIDNFCLKKQK